MKSAPFDGFATIVPRRREMSVRGKRIEHTSIHVRHSEAVRHARLRIVVVVGSDGSISHTKYLPFNFAISGNSNFPFCSHKNKNNRTAWNNLRLQVLLYGFVVRHSLKRTETWVWRVKSKKYSYTAATSSTSTRIFLF